MLPELKKNKIMGNKTEFEQYTESKAAAQEHNQEIQNTRIGGLGGSDADLLLRIGRNGMSAINATDMKRLSVMMGIAKPEPFGGNIYTNAGHAFEDLAETLIPVGKMTMKREEKIERKLARNFATFAHADFTMRYRKNAKAFDVVECKFVQKETDKVAQEYAAQLQWYFILGARSVTLYHGRGQVDPFDPKTVEATAYQIEANEEIMGAILAGLKELDQAITDGWKPITPDKQHFLETSMTVQNAFTKLQSISVQKKQMEAEEAEAKAIIESYMNDFECSNIYDDFGNMVVMTKASTSRTFDSAKLLKAHPEFNTDEFYKTSNRKASISYKPGKNQE